MLNFRELTPEENAKYDKYQKIKTAISQLELQKLEKEKAVEYYERQKDMDWIPVIVWGLLLLSQIVILVLDFVFGFWNLAFNIAIAFAAGTPVLGTIFGIAFFLSLDKYLCKNSKSQKYMMKSMKKGVENRWIYAGKMNDELANIRSELRILKKEAGYLKAELDKIEQAE